MRILIVTDISFYMRGGVPAEVRSILGGLSARGHALALASHMPLDEFAGVAHFRMSMPIRNSVTGEIAAALREFRPDFVHILSMNSRGVSLLAPLLRHHRWALTVHSLPPHERKLTALHGSEVLHYGARWLRFLANQLAWRWLLRRGILPLVVVHSKDVESTVVRYGCAREGVRSIALPFIGGDSEQVARAVSGSPLLVTVGGYAHTKGQHDLIKAMPALVQRFPRLRCQLVGEVRDNSYVAHLKSLAQKLGVADRLLVTPDLSQADKRAALLAADVYVQPSHEEGFCLAYAEAAAVVPRLVGTDTGAIAAISRDDPGARVVQVRDAAGIAAAVQELLEWTVPIDHMSKRSARLSARFSEAAYLDRHEEMYAESR